MNKQPKRAQDKARTKPKITAVLAVYSLYLLSLFRRVEREATFLHNPLRFLRAPREAEFFDEGEDVAGELFLELWHITHEHKERLGLPTPTGKVRNRQHSETGVGGGWER